MTRITRLWPFLLPFVLVNCSAGTPSSETVSEGTFTPPPQPGSSITHTKLCECKTCEEASCCNGEPENDEQKADDAGLGLNVALCGQCLRQVYRVALVDSCEERAPHGCCPDSAVIR